MKHLIWNLIFLSGLLFPFSEGQNLYATHLVGASITYECTGPCTYRVIHKSYYDCTGGAFSGFLPINPINRPSAINAELLAGLQGLTITGDAGCPAPTALGSGWALEGLHEVTPLCPGFLTPMPGVPSTTGCDGTNPNPIINGVAELVMFRDFDFCNAPSTCDNYTISWDVCCRNATITSLNAPQSTGIALSQNLNTSSNTCNSSPIFNQSPITYICSGQPTFVDLGATDPDGDSLHYVLDTCLNNVFLPINYAVGYSPSVPLGPTWTTSLDPNTGGLTILPSTTGIQVVGVICLRVLEYRNGMLIGETSTDFQLNVLPSCDPNQLPVINGLQQISGATQSSPTSLQGCIGNLLEFEIPISDPDINDTLSIETNVDAVLPGAIVSYSGINPKIMHVTWTPTANLAGTSGAFFVRALDSSCPIPGADGEVFNFSFTAGCVEGIVTQTACADSSGAIDVSVVGNSGPYSFVWNTGDTTEDLSGLTVGIYSVDVFDSVGVYISSASFLIEASDIQLSFTSSQPQCGQQDGQISASIAGGTPPFDLLWNTGATDSTISGLAPGGYSLTVTDSAGCFQKETLLLAQPDSCFVSYTGTVFQDDNGNCIQDPGEPGVPHVYMDITPGSAIFTDSAGYYTLQVDPGNHVIQARIGPGYSFICPSTNSISVSGPNYGDVIRDLDFALDFDTIQDVSIHVALGRARPGFGRHDNITYRNDGTIPMDGTVSFTFDTTLSLSWVRPPYVSYDSSVQILTWNYQNLMPGESRAIGVRTLVPTSAQAGDILDFSANISPLINDSTPANNQKNASVVVVNSFDPNDKLVTPTGIEAEGFILTTQKELDYTVRFQNTGTAPAIFIVVRDTVDSHVDMATFRPAGQSHPYSLSVEEDSILVFTFEDIYLPDSTSDLTGSQGYLSFSIKLEDDLSPGTTIRNSAGIYFDFNEPIITNEVVNTLYTQPEVGISSADSLCSGSLIYGNIIEAGMPPYDFVWSDGSVFSQENSDSSSIQAAESGWYQLTVTDQFGFSATDSVNISVFESPVAAFSYTADGTSIQFADTSVNGVSRLWLFGDGSTSTELNPAHTYAGSGQYVVQLISSNVCGNDTTSLEIGIYATGIESEVFSQSVQVIPHPVRGASKIVFSNPTYQAFTLRITDIQGKTVFVNKDQRKDFFEIEKGKLPPGIYLYRLEGKFIHSGKLLIQ